jgi:hypothetical protein
MSLPRKKIQEHIDRINELIGWADFNFGKDGKEMATQNLLNNISIEVEAALGLFKENEECKTPKFCVKCHPLVVCEVCRKEINEST